MRAEIILVGDELLEDMHGVQPDYMADLLREIGSDPTVRGYVLGRLTCVGDAPGELAPVLIDACERTVDLVVTVGGVSVGRRDYLPGVWEELGLKAVVRGVAMQPGKPVFSTASNACWSACRCASSSIS